MLGMEDVVFKLGFCVREGFWGGSLGVEVCGGGEAMGASLGGSAIFDPVELREFTLGVGDFW